MRVFYKQGQKHSSDEVLNILRDFLNLFIKCSHSNLLNPVTANVPIKSTDLQSKSSDRFLYDGNIGR